MSSSNLATQAIAQLCSQYMSERLHQQIASGCKQVVILGAGFEAHRVQPVTPGVHYFQIDQTVQVDQTATIHTKLISVPVHQMTANTTYIASSYLQPHLIELLQSHQFDIHLPTYFVWAGSVPYLRRGDIIALIDTLRNQVRQFHLSFDYWSHQRVNCSVTDPALNQTLDRLNYPDTHCITAFKNIATFTKALGLELLETASIAQLHDRYSPQSSLPSTLLHFYGVCTIARRGLRW